LIPGDFDQSQIEPIGTILKKLQKKEIFPLVEFSRCDYYSLDNFGATAG
jgi:hypothetical protein